MAAKKRARKGMGFEAAAQEVAKRQNLPMKRARAVIASGARKASPEAKRRNPNLRKVKGAAKKKGRRGRG